MQLDSSTVIARAAAIPDTRALRNAFGAFPTGVTVVTALSPEGTPLGVTVNSFASVSLAPPLVLWSQACSSPSHTAFFQARTMVINILSEDQSWLSAKFSRPGDDRFSGIDFTSAACGTPVLAGCAATLVCSVADRHYGGDHTIFLCGVNEYENHHRAPLIFAGGSYLKRSD
ncbi:flavin reductase family protein [Variovorax paradoxus]|uniref:flavin reductase family protein n=1 Tax=Variovorax paradoxus TaxID=34073 RepID=UPI0029C93998|nr:flavin reductase family protein [Variovorax paradoxus]WPH18123.1 flavin reductase family protein [Variovorax paradoxus]